MSIYLSPVGPYGLDCMCRATHQLQCDEQKQQQGVHHPGCIAWQQQPARDGSSATSQHQDPHRQQPHPSMQHQKQPQHFQQQQGDGDWALGQGSCVQISPVPDNPAGARQQQPEPHQRQGWQLNSVPAAEHKIQDRQHLQNTVSVIVPSLRSKAEGHQCQQQQQQQQLHQQQQQQQFCKQQPWQEQPWQKRSCRQGTLYDHNTHMSSLTEATPQPLSDISNEQAAKQRAQAVAAGASSAIAGWPRWDPCGPSHPASAAAGSSRASSSEQGHRCHSSSCWLQQGCNMRCSSAARSRQRHS